MQKVFMGLIYGFWDMYGASIGFTAQGCNNEESTGKEDWQ